MSADRSQWPDWDKPATKGDVVSAMVWTEAYILRAVQYVQALNSQVPEDMKAKMDALTEESDDFNRKIAQIGGVKP